MKKPSPRRVFSFRKAIFGMVLVLIVVFVGWYAYHMYTRPRSLVITEWGVKMPLSESDSDAYYSMAASNGVHLSTYRLSDLTYEYSGCRSGADDLYLTRTTIDPRQPNTVRIGGYYYYQGGFVETSCGSGFSQTFADKIAPIDKALRADAAKLTAQ